MANNNRATIEGGIINPLDPDQFYIKIGKHTVKFYCLPDITDSKSASYNDEPIIGRSFPMKTYSHSENRTITVQLHFFVIKESDINENIDNLFNIKSAVYPRDGNGGTPFRPPPVCQLKFGRLLGIDPVCVILRSYSVKFPTDVAWDQGTFLPYKFDIDTTWEEAPNSANLPGQEKIIASGLG